MTYLYLFAVFFKIGLFSFGGGYAIITVIGREVERMGWLTSAQYADILAISQMTPGPLAINAATYVGSKLFMGIGVINSVMGAFFATFGVVLPSFIIVVIVANLYEKFKTSRLVDSAMNAVRPAIVGVMGSAVISFGLLAMFKDGAFVPQSLIIIFLILLFSFKTKISSVWLIVLSAILGIILL